VIDAEELRRRLPMSAAIDALERAFREEDPSSAPARSRVPTPAGELLAMPAAGAAGIGVKLVTVTPANPDRGLPLIDAAYVLFDPVTQRLRAVIEGAALTALRTAAVSGLATRHLARAGAHRLVIFGAGVQARAHLDAMRAERAVDELVVVSRSPERAEDLAAHARSLGLEASIGSPGAVAAADLVCACTTSTTPLFEGAALAAGTHVNAVGTHRPQDRELDTATIRRARVLVETRDAAFAEAGDIVIPVEEGVVDRSHVAADLAELVHGLRVRRSDEDVTVFKSVGLAFEDLAVAAAALAEGAEA
jgi:ornithine cyclodeaminase